MKPDLKITMVQTSLFWEDNEKNLDHFGQIVSTITEETHLIVLPEMFSSGFTMNASSVAEDMEGLAVKWMKKTALEKKCCITGSLVIKENDKFYNRLVWMNPDGSVEFYNKRHLFRMAGEHKVYSSGKERKIFKCNGWNIFPQVCYDLRFPAFSRNKLMSNDPYVPEYDVLLYVANWPQKRSFAWKTLLPARAIENQSFLVGVNRVGEDGQNISYSGDSAVYNPLGEEVSLMREFEDATETVTISYSELEKLREVFPVLRDADDFSFDL